MPAFGVALRNFTPPDERPDFGAILKLASRAEELGFSIAWMWDHILLGSRRVFPILEPLPLIAAIASRSSRLRLGTMLLMSLRNPVQAAKTLATLDYISSGRLVIGAIAGWYEKEFRALGIDYARRGELLERNFELVRRLLSQDSVTARLNSYDLERVTIEPKPLQKPTPPMLMGGYVENVLNRVARLADGWVSYCYTPRFFRESWEKIVQYARGYGRDPSSLTNLELVPICVDKDRDYAERRIKLFAEKGYLDFPPWSKATLESAIMGRPDECMRQINRYLEAGVENLVLIPCDYELEQIEIAGEEILPAFLRR